MALDDLSVCNRNDVSFRQVILTLEVKEVRLPGVSCYYDLKELGDEKWILNFYKFNGGSKANLSPGKYFVSGKYHKMEIEYWDLGGKLFAVPLYYYNGVDKYDKRGKVLK